MRDIVYFIGAALSALFLTAPARAQAPTQLALAGASVSSWQMPLQPSAQTQLGSDPLWFRAEVPPASPEDRTLRGNVTAGHRTPPATCQRSWCRGLSWTFSSIMRTVADAPSRGTLPEPQTGLAVTEDLAWPLREGLKLQFGAGLGDRVALYAPLRPGGGAVAMKTQAGLAAELDQFGGPPMRVSLNLVNIRPMAGDEGPPLPEDCSLSLEVAAKAGAPFRVDAPCNGRGRIGFGLRANF